MTTQSTCRCDGKTRALEPCQFTCRHCLVRFHADSTPRPKLCETCARKLALCPLCEAPA